MDLSGAIQINVTAPRQLETHAVEICEHKGIGHPDTLTDGACEVAAVALATAYREAFGRILHFNVDKGLLVAGRSEPRFGGGRVVRPPRLIVCGRAADPAGRFDVAATAAAAARSYFRRVLGPAAEHFRIESAIHQSSASLEQVYRGAGVPKVANDTSFGVGFAPFSSLEQAVLDAAALLRSAAFQQRHPAAGNDFKIMGLRRGAEIQLTIALAIVDRHIESAAAYFEAKRAMAASLAAALPGVHKLAINALDRANATDESGLYLTVTGLSAEMGDDGQVGRGNRVNGLITPDRPMSLEAAAGKNPSSHVGKIYNVLAHRIAQRICAELPEVTQASVRLLSAIGRPIDEPWAAVVEVAAPDTSAIRERVAAITNDQFRAVGQLCEALAKGEIPVY